jgi:hypothetical protein
MMLNEEELIAPRKFSKFSPLRKRWDKKFFSYIVPKAVKPKTLRLKT